MKPGFALSLSFEGISLLHRAAGGWRLVGEVGLDAPDLGASLGELRALAQALEPGSLRCKLIIPNDQIRYLTVDTATPDPDARQEIVAAALDEATPYSVQDLAYDTAPDGDQTHVAAVAHETLAEAEAFAVEHAFHPVCFVAIPGDQPFLGEPFFGPTKHAASLPGGSSVEPDGIAVVVIGPAEMPMAAKDPAPEDAPDEAGDLGIEDDDKGQVDASVEDVVEDHEPDKPAPVATPPKPDHAPGLKDSAQSVAKPDDAAAQATPAPVAGFSSRRRAPAKPAERKEPSVTASPPPPAKPGTADAAKRSAPPAAPPAAPTAAPAAIPAAKPVEPPKVPKPVAATLPPPALARALAASPGIDREDKPTENQPKPAAPGVSAADMASAKLKSAGAKVGGFLSRRSKQKPKAPPPLAKPAPSPAPRPAMPQPELVAAPPEHSPKVPKPRTEAARMTVFGARKDEDQVGGKPRFLGLILTAVLLLFLVAIAAWASIFVEGGISGMFGRGSYETDLAAEPEPEPAPRSIAEPAPLLDEPIVPDQPTDPVEDPPLTSALPEDPQIDLASLPTDEQSLTETDAAVLDALREADVDAREDPTAEVAARYAATGIWDAAPDRLETPSIISLDDMYVASIDRTDLSQDAVALPGIAELQTDEQIRSVASPAAAGTGFALDTRGLVTPTVQGTMNPDGVLVYLGRPPSVPPATPARLDPEGERDEVRERLAGLRPKLRPGGLEERAQRTALGGLTREELGGVRPKLRPEDNKNVLEADETPTALAIATSRSPKVRPAGFADKVKAATATARSDSGTSTDDEDEPETVLAAVAPTTVSPSIPSSASVARQATMDNAINLRQINLIGVYGTPANRRALVRLPSGRYKKVKVGDTVDGGRVVAIGDSELRLQKSGRNTTLKIPSG